MYRFFAEHDEMVDNVRVDDNDSSSLSMLMDFYVHVMAAATKNIYLKFSFISHIF